MNRGQAAEAVAKQIAKRKAFAIVIIIDDDGESIGVARFGDAADRALVIEALERHADNLRAEMGAAS